MFSEIPEMKSTWIINGTDGPSSGYSGVNLTEWGSVSVLLQKFSLRYKRQ
ncbi:hypothetical protein XSR1_260055 [Xenorhabdus szentirmaii DSM 16338]|uniref:Uncharacterized protein n=1 Tax=Xenorhabdus szentirmaii DSM 16338 TaxID=1427518 RepID=W1IZB6_9GAMM|nr:hypothetical protein XSR1_260055 [Xenorhabdus szentirmaii DSM 16338]